MTKIASTATTPLWLTLITGGNNDFYLEVSENADVNVFSSQLTDLPSTAHEPQMTAPARRGSFRRSAAQTSRGTLKDSGRRGSSGGRPCLLFQSRLSATMLMTPSPSS